MGFADVSLQVRQMSGKAYPLQIEAGCFSSDSSSADVPTRLTHVVGGLSFSCLSGTAMGGMCIGRPMIGSVCDGGFVGFTTCGDSDSITSYIVAGW